MPRYGGKPAVTLRKRSVWPPAKQQRGKRNKDPNIRPKADGAKIAIVLTYFAVNIPLP